MIRPLLSLCTPDWVFCSLSKTDPLLFINKSNVLFVRQRLWKMWFIDPHGGQIVLEVNLKQSVIIVVTLATTGRVQKLCASVLIHLPYFRLNFDIFDPILFCLHMLPMGSIKTTTNKKKSIYPSPTDHMHSLLKLDDHAFSPYTWARQIQNYEKLSKV